MVTMRREATEEEIARRAHEISESDDRGSDEENWWRAEQELCEQPRARPAGRLRRSSTSEPKPAEKPARAKKAKPAQE
jgi:hypothetical protein